jgi:hypothetical protein
MKSVTLILMLASSVSWAHPGTGIVMDTKGNVFYTDLQQVWKINKQGVKSIAVRNVHTHELYIDQQDNLFGEHLWFDGSADQWGHFVWRLTADGEFEKIIPETEGFLANYSFVRDHLGNMYWADRGLTCQKIARKNRDGSIDKLGDQCFHNIRKIITNKEGWVYVMDFQDVKRLDQQGKVSTIASKIANKSWVQSNPENQNSVMSIWDDSAGNIYAAIYSNRQVKRFNKIGIEEVVLQTNQPWAPSGGMVTPDGELWVLETSDINEVRVERILKDKRRFIY